MEAPLTMESVQAHERAACGNTIVTCGVEAAVLCSSIMEILPHD